MKDTGEKLGEFLDKVKEELYIKEEKEMTKDEYEWAIGILENHRELLQLECERLGRDNQKLRKLNKGLWNLVEKKENA